MSDSFNPYAEWLGLTSGGSSPNHYVLLGLEPFTSDAQQIKLAADRAVTRVRGFRPGDKARYWAALLDEIDAARKCLSDEDSRRQYDDRLRSSGTGNSDSSSTPSALAASASLSKPTGDPAMYPPGMGGPLPERYGPAGPAPDHAPQQLASTNGGMGASRFAPGYDVAATSSSSAMNPQPAVAAPFSAAQNSNPVTQPGRVPMGRDAGGAAANVDPMAPVYGVQPLVDPMAPIADASVATPAQSYGAIPQAQAYGQPGYGTSNYGLPDYGATMQPIAAVPLQGTSSANPMAPVALPIGPGGYEAASYSPFTYSDGDSQAAPSWGGTIGSGSTVETAVPTGGASTLPQMAATIAKPTGSRPKLLLLGVVAGVTLLLGGMVLLLAMGQQSEDANDQRAIASVEPETEVNGDPLPSAIDDDTPIVRPEPEPEVEPQPTPDPEPVPNAQPDPSSPPITTPTPQREPPLPPEPQPQPEPEPTPEPAPRPMLTPQEKAALKQALISARQAMTDADLATAKARLAEAERLARTDEQIALVERTKELEHYVTRFWQAFDKAYAGLQPTNILTVDTAEAAIVEVRPDALVIKWFGRNRTIPREGMPPGLVMAIANSWFNEEPANKLVKGAYYFVNNKPDKAKQMWSEAGASGLPVENLMLVLDDNYEL